MMAYILPRKPFDNTKELINTHTGEVADNNVNAETAVSIGNHVLKQMKGELVSSYTFKKKESAVVMKSMSTIEIEDDTVTVDPQLLCQRLLASVQGMVADVDIQMAFTYELSNYPSSLVGSDGLLRAEDKPKLANEIWKIAGDPTNELPDNVHYVIDGGSLLHTIKWALTLELVSSDHS